MSNRQLMRLFKWLLVVGCALCVWHTLGYGNWTYGYIYTPSSLSKRYPHAQPFKYRNRKRVNSHNTELNETELAELVERSKILPKHSKNKANHRNISGQPTLPSWLFYQMSFQGDKWKYNATNFHKFKKDLKDIKLNSRTHMVLSENNTSVGDKLPCYFCKANDTVKVQPWFTQAMPKSSPLTGKSFKRCSVVGNSGILVNSTCGEEIDKADYVFRCNLAPIAKYVDDAGQRTNLTTLNPSLIWSRYNLLGSQNLTKKFNSDLAEYSGTIFAPCLGDPSWIKTCQRAISRFKSYSAKMTLGHPEHFRKVWDFWRNRGLQQVLSTGFYLTNTAIELCDEVQLFGFWPFPYTFYSDDPIRYHYFDKVKAKAETHSMASEFWQLWQMHQDGIIRLHLTPCYSEPNPIVAEHVV